VRNCKVTNVEADGTHQKPPFHTG